MNISSTNTSYKYENSDKHHSVKVQDQISSIWHTPSTSGNNGDRLFSRGVTRCTAERTAVVPCAAGCSRLLETGRGEASRLSSLLFS